MCYSLRPRSNHAYAASRAPSFFFNYLANLRSTPIALFRPAALRCSFLIFSNFVPETRYHCLLTNRRSVAKLSRQSNPFRPSTVQMKRPKDVTATPQQHEAIRRSERERPQRISGGGPLGVLPDLQIPQHAPDLGEIHRTSIATAEALAAAYLADETAMITSSAPDSVRMDARTLVTPASEGAPMSIEENLFH